MILGSFLACLGSGHVCIKNTHTSVAGWVCLMLLPGLGVGPFFTCPDICVQASDEPRHLAMAVAMCGFFRSLGQAIGIAIGVVNFQNCMYSKLIKNPAHVSHADEYTRDVASLVETLRKIPESAAKEDLRTAYSDGLRIVWAVCCALAGCSALLSFLIRDYTLITDESAQEGVKEETEYLADKVNMDHDFIYTVGI